MQCPQFRVRVFLFCWKAESLGYVFFFSLPPPVPHFHFHPGKCLWCWALPTGNPFPGFSALKLHVARVCGPHEPSSSSSTCPVPARSFRTPFLTRTQTRICYQDPNTQAPAARSRAPSLMSCKVDFVYLTIVRLAWLMLSLVLLAWPLQNWLLLAELQLATTGLSFLPCSCNVSGISLWCWGWCTRFFPFLIFCPIKICSVRAGTLFSVKLEWSLIW